MLPQMEAIASLHGRTHFRGRKPLLPSAERKHCFLPRKEASVSFRGKKQLLPSAEGRNCFLSRMDAIASFRGKKQFHPSAEGINCHLPQEEAIASFRRKRQLLLPAEGNNSFCGGREGPVYHGGPVYNGSQSGKSRWLGNPWLSETLVIRENAWSSFFRNLVLSPVRSP